MTKKLSFFHLCCMAIFLWTYSFFKEHVLIPYAETINFSAKIFNRLVLLSLLCPYSTNVFVLLEVFGFHSEEQRALMYKKWYIWIAAVVSAIAFSVLMYIVCCNMESVAEKIGVLVSAIVLFAPNLFTSAWLLTKKDDIGGRKKDVD